MDTNQATTAFASLSQQTRLDVFRLLIKAGKKGLLSGEMGEILAVRQNTMSTNLNILLRAGLIRNERHGRSVRYFADMEGIGGLIDYLLQDCCGGAPEQCKPIITTICGGATEASALKIKTEMTNRMKIYHNPACGTSRNTLEMIRKAGVEPTIIEYLKTPPTRDELIKLIEAMPINTRQLLRKKGTPYEELQLDNPDLTDDQLVDAMMEHPILINRPIVVSEKGTNLCRPSEVVLDLLPADIGTFTKEDGQVVDAGKGQ